MMKGYKTYIGLALVVIFNLIGIYLKDISTTTGVASIIAVIPATGFRMVLARIEALLDNPVVAAVAQDVSGVASSNAPQA